jgi:hypothetical protein
MPVARASDVPDWMVSRLAPGLLLVSLLVWAAMQVVSWPGYYSMIPASGTVAMLADATLRGEVPGRAQGDTFLGTYYLPPFPLVVAAARSAGLSWKDALRTASVVAAALLLVASAWLAAALGGGRAGAMLAVALAAAAYFFKISSLEGRADQLAIAFAVAGLAAWTRDPEARGWSTPALAAAALLTKATALTLPLAITGWMLVAGRPRRLPAFFFRLAACLLIGVLLLSPARAAAWYLYVMQGLASSPPGTWNLLRGPAEMVRYLGICPEAVVAAALGIAWLAVPARRGSPVAFFAMVSGAIALAMECNYGAGANHLDELAAVLAVCGGVAAAGVSVETDRSRPEARATMPALAWPLALAMAFAITGASWRDLLTTVRHARNDYNRRIEILDIVRREPGAVLTEDPLIALAAGKRPPFADAGALRSFSLRARPEAMAVIAAIEEQRFGLLVLNDALDSPSPWYRDMHFGMRAAAAMRSRYRPWAYRAGYHLYHPRQSVP